MATKNISQKAKLAPASCGMHRDISKIIVSTSTQQVAEYIRDLTRELADMALATRLDLIAYHLTVLSREASIAARGGVREDQVEI